MDFIGRFLYISILLLIGADAVLLFYLFKFKYINFQQFLRINANKTAPVQRQEQTGADLWSEIKNG